jgi:hypothetical protein
MKTLLPVLFSALLLAGGDTEKPHISDLTVALEAGNINIGFVLANVFDDELVERIQTGLPTGFDFKLKLVKNQRWWWFDPAVRAADFHVVAMYNAVTGEYLVNYKQDGKLIDSRVVREIPELRDAMTRFESLQAFDTEGLETKKRLWVRVRAELGSRHLLFLIPTTIETDWAESRRFRLPEIPE